MGSKYINRTVGNFFIGILFCNKIFLLNPTVSWVASWDSSNSIRWIPDKNAKSVLPGNYRTTLSVSWCETFISVFFACGLVIPVFIVFRKRASRQTKNAPKNRSRYNALTGSAFLFPALFLRGMASLRRKCYKQSLRILKMLYKCEHNFLHVCKTRQKFQNQPSWLWNWRMSFVLVVYWPLMSTGLLLKGSVTYRNIEQLELISIYQATMLDVSYRSHSERTGTQRTCKNN